MNSVVESTQNDPHDSQNDLTARADDELAQAYEKIKSADKQLAHVNEQLSKLERGHARPEKARGKSALRGLIGLLLAAFICAAALVSQSSLGDTARLMVADWLPLPTATSSQPQAESAPPEQAVQVADAEPAEPQPATPAQTMPEAVAPTVTSPELMEQLQNLDRDVANLGQRIEQLNANQEQMKANEEQMIRDNAKLAEQLKAGQEQIARLVPKTPDRTHDQASPQDPKLRTSAAPVPSGRPVAASAARPASAVPPPPSPRVRRPIPPTESVQ